ncbi:hypothetical protein AHAS_Ahas10G0084900 [Arachis hypogaea]
MGMSETLDRTFIVEEVLAILKYMHPTKVPGPDGMSTLFYQKMWKIVGDNVINCVLHILNDNVNPNLLNSTYICMISKYQKLPNIQKI